MLVLAMVLAPNASSAQAFGRQESVIHVSESRGYSSDEVFNISTNAMLQHPRVKLTLKSSEAWVWKKVEKAGLDKSLVRTIATVAAPIVAGKISTRGLHMHWEPVKGLLLRPDIDYYLDSKRYGLAFSISWRF